MLSVAHAVEAILTTTPVAPPTTIPLRQLSGTVLRQTIRMERDQPPFDRVAMDGIAVHAASVTVEQPLRIIGTQAAGAKPLTLADKTACIEVMTGAPLPAGSDTVIPIEQLHVADGLARIHAGSSLIAGQHIHRRGSDAHAGAELLQAGTRLGAVEIAVIASAGLAAAQACAPPRVAVVSTGDELIEPGEPIADWQIRRSNSYAVMAALQRHGFTNLHDEQVRDDVDLLAQRISALVEAHDVLILSGGVSMGKFDHVPRVLTGMGVQQVLHKVAQRPGKPMWFGARADGKAIFALPGNPVSVLMCLYRYVLPGLLHGMGASVPAPQMTALAEPAKAHPELTAFMPVQLITDAQGVTRAHPRPTRGSGDFISLLGTDGFVQLPAGAGVLEPGTIVQVFHW